MRTLHVTSFMFLVNTVVLSICVAAINQEPLVAWAVVNGVATFCTQVGLLIGAFDGKET